MPLAQIRHSTSDARHMTLRDRLVKEWIEQQPGLTEPIIIEERAPLYSDLLHLYVVWGEWAGMGQRERSKIIMDAYQVARPEHSENVAAVTVAMGLTREEAKHMGIEYATLDPVA